MKKILAPHKEQDGWVYWRVFVRPAKRDNMHKPMRSAIRLVKFIGDKLMELPPVALEKDGTRFGYRDDLPGSRIISSRRVERAVETDDFLRLCAEEGLGAQFVPRRHIEGVGDDYWMVCSSSGGFSVHVGVTPRGLVEPLAPRYAAWGHTLREAYYRYKAAAGEQS